MTHADLYSAVFAHILTQGTSQHIAIAEGSRGSSLVYIDILKNDLLHILFFLPNLRR
jgi:hypothetical protein